MARSLNQLGALRDALAEQQAARERERAAKAQREREAAADAELFKRSVGPVTPLRAAARSPFKVLIVAR